MFLNILRQVGVPTCWNRSHWLGLCCNHALNRKPDFEFILWYQLVFYRKSILIMDTYLSPKLECPVKNFKLCLGRRLQSMCDHLQRNVIKSQQNYIKIEIKRQYMCILLCDTNFTMIVIFNWNRSQSLKMTLISAVIFSVVLKKNKYKHKKTVPIIKVTQKLCIYICIASCQWAHTHEIQMIRNCSIKLCQKYCIVLISKLALICTLYKSSNSSCLK